MEWYIKPSLVIFSLVLPREKKMSMLQSPSRYKNCQQEEKTMDLLHHLDRYCNSKYAQVIEQRIQKAERRIESLLSPTNYACTFCTRFLRKEPFLLFLRELRHFYCNVSFSADPVLGLNILLYWAGLSNLNI